MKEYPIAGADERTPSVPYYFSWINNTNEGSTEAQTLTNLDFFRYLKERFGMKIVVYAWDAGNFDGASLGYGDVKGEKFLSQYPRGYKPIVEKAAEIGVRLGLWGSPDGFGNDPETEKERFDFFVHLCRDYNFAAFKLDGVCGKLRPEKAGLYAKMIEECRKYSPDLILLNHRLDFYEAQKYVTTFLWNGEETYTDVFTHNRVTGMHNRVYMFSRGRVLSEKGELLRLSEDHGVCLSSSLDYFEDELVYQAFGRCLILAPEIYGNPWFLRDNELPRLARVYNLHARFRDILVNGLDISSLYGCDSVSRGTLDHRFICTGNDGWEPKEIFLKLDKSIGLETEKDVAVILRHPYNKLVGVFSPGESVRLELLPFRAALIEIAQPESADPVLTNCEYEVITESSKGEPTEINVVSAEGEDVYLLSGGKKTFYKKCEKTDKKEKPPVFLGDLSEEIRSGENFEKLYEAAMFAIDNDSLEARCIKRSGETSIPEVKRARDAFFSQKTYILRGCENAALFDGRDDTFFDAQSRCYCDRNLRIDGGCLRVDFGEEVFADEVVLEVFSADEPTREVPKQLIPEFAEFSRDLSKWKKSGAAVVEVSAEPYAQDVVKFTVHSIYPVKGKKLRLRYALNGSLRYLRVPEPPDRIYSVRLIAGGKDVVLTHPFANNTQAHYSKRPTVLVKKGSVVIPEYADGDYLAVAVNGEHGAERVYCTAEIEGKLYGFNGRASAYKANIWEHRVCDEERNNTFFLTLPKGLSRKTANIYVSFSDKDRLDASCKAYFCVRHG
ncbi:MAG: hypothetical protein IJS90_02680 [Clostridia bacterium]|nr:hypothetical protein [Clostridia bacterium]